MFESESEEEEFIPAILQRPTVANHVVHESFTADTRDHEDHTFCGVMFDIQCKGQDDDGAPLEFLQVDSVSVRGDLGPLTVWTTEHGYKGKEHDANSWECVYEWTHPPSHQEYQQLELTTPIKLSPGQRRGLYVHSKLSGDDAIVYDNQRSHVTHEDKVFRMLPGLAHLSNRPFGRHGMWGFPWRERREFVGQISYGVGYTLWNPSAELHKRFPLNFRNAVMALLLCARRQESPLYWLQDEVVFYILNMCKHDWFEPAKPRNIEKGSRKGCGRGAGHIGRGFGFRTLFDQGGQSGYNVGLLGRTPQQTEPRSRPSTASSDDEDGDDDDDELEHLWTTRYRVMPPSSRRGGEGSAPLRDVDETDDEASMDRSDLHVSEVDSQDDHDPGN